MKIDSAARVASQGRLLRRRQRATLLVVFAAASDNKFHDYFKLKIYESMKREYSSRR